MEDTTEAINENNFSRIKYLLIGNVDTKKIMTEYSSTSNANEIKKEINQIFAKECKTQLKKYNERNKITSKDSIYYFIIEKPNIIFIILVDEDYPEETVFELLEKIQKKQITKMLNEETNELNSEGRLELKNIIDIYQKKNGDEDGDKNDKVNEDKNIKENNGKDNLNIDKEKNNDINLTLNIDDLQTKNDEFLLTDTKKKWSIKNLQIWKNYRTYLYLALIVLIILIVEFLI
jgi:hypothetical protein